MMNRFTKRLMNFVKDSDGAINVEGVLWLPVYAFFLVLVVDVSLMMNGQTQVQRTLQDLNRLASNGYYTDEAAFEARAQSMLNHLSDNVVVEASIDNATGVVSAVATIPATDLMIVGTLPKFAGFNITVGASHMIES